MNEFIVTLLNFSANILPHVLAVAVALVVGLLIFVLRRKIVTLLSKLLKKFTSHIACASDIIDAAEKPAVGFLTVLAGYLFLSLLQEHFLPEASKIASFLLMVLKISLIACITRVAMDATTPLVSRLQNASQKLDTNVLDTTVTVFISKIIKIVLLIISAVIIVDEVGYDISGLITGLGISGLTLSLAAQDTAKNLFGGIVIIIDKPFQVGDWIEVAGMQGVVSDISLRSTRLRTFKDTEIIIPNSTLANGNIINWSRMNKRKVEMTMPVVPQTSPEKLAAATESIRQLLRQHAHVDNEEIVAVLNDFSATAVTLMISYFLIDTEFADYMNIKEEINLQIMRVLAEEGLIPSRNP